MPSSSSDLHEQGLPVGRRVPASVPTGRRTPPRCPWAAARASRIPVGRTPPSTGCAATANTERACAKWCVRGRPRLSAAAPYGPNCPRVFHHWARSISAQAADDQPQLQEALEVNKGPGHHERVYDPGCRRGTQWRAKTDPSQHPTCPWIRIASDCSCHIDATSLVRHPSIQRPASFEVCGHGSRIFWSVWIPHAFCTESTSVGRSLWHVPHPASAAMSASTRDTIDPGMWPAATADLTRERAHARRSRSAAPARAWRSRRGGASPGSPRRRGVRRAAHRPRGARRAR